MYYYFNRSTGYAMSHLSQKFSIQLDNKSDSNDNTPKNNILLEDIVTKVSLGPFVLESIPRNSFQLISTKKSSLTQSIPTLNLKLPTFFRANLMLIKSDTSITSITSNELLLDILPSPRSINTLQLLSSLSSTSITHLLSSSINPSIRSHIIQPPQSVVIENIELSTVNNYHITYLFIHSFIYFYFIFILF